MWLFYSELQTYMCFEYFSFLFKIIKRIEYVIMQIFYRSDDFPYIIPYIPLQYSHLL